MENIALKCDLCEKICKSRGGLKLHQIRKHKVINNQSEATSNEYSDATTSKKEPLCIETICGLVATAGRSVLDSDLYPEYLKAEIEEYLISLTNETVTQLHFDIQDLQCTDTEKCYAVLYSKFMKNSKIYLQTLSESSSKLVMMKFVHLFVGSIQTKNIPESIATKSFSDREVAGLQYLAGYVFHNLYKKLKNSKSYNSIENQQSLAILLAGKSVSPNPSLKLVSALSRGGLWEINDNVQKLFVICEKYFCIQTEKSGIRNIDIDCMTNILMQFTYIQDFFGLIVSAADTEPSKEIVKNMLFSIINLYLKVRSFSYAKDIICKHRTSSKQKKSKALRKEIKRSSEIKTKEKSTTSKVYT